VIPEPWAKPVCPSARHRRDSPYFGCRWFGASR
jgi:hypothetical protein